MSFFSVLALPRPLCKSSFIWSIPMSPLPDPRPAHQVVPVWAELAQAGIPDILDLQLCPSPPPPSLCLSPRLPVVSLLVPFLPLSFSSSASSQPEAIIWGC